MILNRGCLDTLELFNLVLSVPELRCEAKVHTSLDLNIIYLCYNVFGTPNLILKILLISFNRQNQLLVCLHLLPHTSGHLKFIWEVTFL